MGWGIGVMRDRDGVEVVGLTGNLQSSVRAHYLHKGQGHHRKAKGWD